MNNQHFINRLIKKSGARPEAEPAAIFMAGLPGAGKTELSKNLIADSGVKFFRIDMDEIAEMIPKYRPETADLFRKLSTTLLSECFKYALHHNISFIMDGTFGSHYAMQNIERSLKHGFRVQVVYAFQDPKVAWEFTKAREKVERRGIKFEGFIESYFKTIKNLMEVNQKYNDHITFDIAIKTKTNEVGDWLSDTDSCEFDEIVKIKYNKDELIKYILGVDK